MQAYAEGFEVLAKSEFDLDLHEIAGIWRYGSVVRSWLLELLARRVRGRGQPPREDQGLRRRLRRGPLDDRRGDRRGRAGAGDHRGALRPLRLAAGRVVRGEGERGAPQPVRRPRGQGGRNEQTSTHRQRRRTRSLEGLPLRRRPEPCTIVIFGASGDLTERKLMPALYSLAFRRLLPEHFAIVGAARTPRTPTTSFREAMKDAVEHYARDEFRQEVWDELARRDALRRSSTTPTSGAGESLAELLRPDRRGARHAAATASTTSPCRPARSARSSRWSAEDRSSDRLEPPDHREAVRPRPRVGARAERARSREHFTESEVFRIDHYLGKETVQNMLALRFANGIFEPIWNRQFIDHVQITVAESIGIEGRAAFYEQAGAIRDIFQNHLLQLLAITAMEPPSDFTADSVRNEKVKVLRSLHTPGPEVGRARAVRARLRRGRRGARLPRGGGRRARLDDRDVRRGEALRRQLALGRHAVLRPHGQAAAAPRDDDRDPVQARAAPAVRGGRGRGAAAERAADPRPAGRGPVARDRREDARAGHVDPDRAHGLPLRQRVPRRAARGVRAADPRRDARRRDAVHARRTRSRSSGRSSTRSSPRWPRDRAAFPNYAAGTWGPPSADELLHRDGRSWRRH